MDARSAAAALDRIDPLGDPEAAHSEADRIMLEALDPEVAAAYRRLMNRSPWWAAA